MRSPVWRTLIACGLFLGLGPTSSLPSPETAEAAPCSQLSIDSTPSGAAIFVDGVATEQTTPHTFVCLAPGKHLFRVQALPAFGTRTIELAPGAKASTTIALVGRARGELSVQTWPPGASVSVNGVPQGTSPRHLTELPAGPAQISLALDGYRDVEGQVDIPADGTEFVVHPMKRPVRLYVGGGVFIGGPLALMAGPTVRFREYDWLWGQVGWGLLIHLNQSEEISGLYGYNRLGRHFIGSCLLASQVLDIPFNYRHGEPFLSLELAVSAGFMLGAVTYYYPAEDDRYGVDYYNAELGTPGSEFNFAFAGRAGFSIGDLSFNYLLLLTPGAAVTTYVQPCSGAYSGACTRAAVDVAVEWPFPVITHLGGITGEVPVW